jgi:hypothetical protein
LIGSGRGATRSVNALLQMEAWTGRAFLDQNFADVVM